jgi:GNAT superfamily N-acetyltransferase
MLNCLVAVEAGELVGVLALLGSSQVKYFFVCPSRQKTGLGKQLWDLASDIGLLGKSISVRSSLVAVPVYERLGFKAAEPPKILSGLHYQTMVATYG